MSSKLDCNLEYIDAHSHPHFRDFDSDREELFDCMQKEGIGTIAVGTDFGTSKKVAELAKEKDFIWASVGIHPTDQENFESKKYKKLLHEKVVAVGECGLDYYRMDESDKKRQIALFEKQIQFAVESKLPLMLHIRSSQNTSNAHDDAFEVLKSYKKEFPALHLHMHFFTAPKEVAKKFLDLDATFGIPGVVSFAKEVQEIVLYLPAEKILIESDSPYAAPVPHRGKRNEPCFIPYTANFIAELKKLDSTNIFLQNAIKTFKLS